MTVGKAAFREQKKTEDDLYHVAGHKNQEKIWEPCLLEKREKGAGKKENRRTAFKKRKSVEK